MSLTRKDLASIIPITLVVLAYFANSEGWNVPLLASNRWTAGAILALGMVTCALGRPAEDGSSPMVVGLALLGGVALLLFALAMWTGSQWMLGLFALDTVVLWAGATLRHATLPQHRPLHPV
jgi:hypothetical protein